MERQRHYKPWGYEDWLYDDGGILLKRICAEKRLSVQVHPDAETARLFGGKAKAEMWCVLKGGPVFAGFKAGVCRADVVRAVEDGSIGDLLVRFDAKAGECYYIPGGLVHSIGEGVSVFEVQQSSDTAYRFYDWGRVDKNGCARNLHVEEALAVMDVSLPPPSAVDSVNCPYFSFRICASGDLPPAERLRLIYDPVADAITELAPSASAKFGNTVFAVEFP